jgi:hypothetical protein
VPGIGALLPGDADVTNGPYAPAFVFSAKGHPGSNET